MPNLIKFKGLPGKAEFKIENPAANLGRPIGQLALGNAALSRYQAAAESLRIPDASHANTIQIWGGLEQYKALQAATSEMLADPNLQPEVRAMLEGGEQIWTRTVSFGAQTFDIHRLAVNAAEIQEGRSQPWMGFKPEDASQCMAIVLDGSGQVQLEFKSGSASYRVSMSEANAEAWGFLKEGIPADPAEMSGVAFFLKPNSAVQTGQTAVKGGLSVYGDAATPASPALQSFRTKAQDILNRTPEGELRHAAQLEIEQAFQKVPEGTPDNQLGPILGPELRRIENKYAPAKKLSKEELKEQKDAARETEGIEKLRAAGIWTADVAAEIDSFRSFNGSAKKIREAVFSAAGVAEANPVKAYNKLRGLLFEISRNKKFAEAHNIDPTKIQKGSNAEVKYFGYKRSAAGLKLTELGSALDNDLIAVDALGHLLDTKFYPRKNYGMDDAGNLDLAVLNQAAKYNQALVAPGSPYKSASIEITGSVSPEFVFQMAARAPEVELLYCFTLPSGEEMVFRLKQGGDGRPSLKRWPSIRDLPERDQMVADGIRKVLQSGKILRDGVLQNDFLKVSDIPSPIHPRIHEILRNAAREDGSIDPTKLTDLNAFKVWEGLIQQKRFSYFAEKSNTVALRRSTDHLKTPVTDAAVDHYIAEAEAVLAEAPAHTRAQYVVTDPAMKIKIRDEFRRRLTAIQVYEAARAQSPEEQNARMNRKALGYTGPEEGYVLDVAHIYQDVVKGLKEEAKGGKAKAGLSLGMTEALPARSYDKANTILTGPQILEALLSPDSKFAHDNHYITIVYPEIIVPDVGEQVVNAKEYDVTDPKDRTKLLNDSHKRNMGRLKNLLAQVERVNDPEVATKLDPADLKALRSLQGILRQSRQEIGQAETELKGLQDERNSQLAKIEADPSVSRSDKGKEKGKIAQSYEARIRAAEEGLLKAYEQVLGTDRYRQYFEYVQKERDSDEVKFIYTIDADGTLRMVQEDLKPGSERPAHSQLAGGRNTYGPGQVWIKGKPVRGEDGRYHIQVNAIDDGSGHYRPGTFDMLPYAQNVFSLAGFDTSHTEFKHAPLPFTPLGEDFDSEIAINAGGRE